MHDIRTNSTGGNECVGLERKEFTTNNLNGKSSCYFKSLAKRSISYNSSGCVDRKRTNERTVEEVVKRKATTMLRRTRTNEGARTSMNLKLAASRPKVQSVFVSLLVKLRVVPVCRSADHRMEIKTNSSLVKTC